MRLLGSVVGFLLLYALVVAQQGWQEYQDPKTGIRLRVPADWAYSPSEDPEILAYFESDDSLNLTLLYEATPLTFVNEGVYTAILNNARSSFEEGLRQEVGDSLQSCSELGRRIHDVGGLQVATLDLISVIDDVPVRTRIRLVLADNKLYYVSISGQQEEFDQSESLVNEILDSFQPKEPRSQRRLSPAVILGVLVGCCACSLAGIGGLIWLILKLVKKTPPAGGSIG